MSAKVATGDGIGEAGIVISYIFRRHSDAGVFLSYFGGLGVSKFIKFSQLLSGILKMTYYL